MIRGRRRNVEGLKLQKKRDKKFVPDFSKAEMIYNNISLDKFTCEKGVLNPKYLDVIQQRSAEYRVANNMPVKVEDETPFGIHYFDDEVIDKISYDDIAPPKWIYGGEFDTVNGFEDFNKYHKLSHKFQRIRHENQVYIFDDKKVVMLSISGQFTKDFNKEYYENLQNRKSLTISYESNCFYVTSNPSDGIRTTRKNQFRALQSLEGKEYFSEYQIDVFKRLMNNKFNLNIYHIEETSLFDVVLTWFKKVNGLKTTDNYINNLINFYPQMRYLKKSKMKLTGAFMKRFKLNGDKVKKLINTYDNINFIKLHYYFTFLGIYKINEIDIQELYDLVKFHVNFETPNNTMETYINAQEILIKGVTDFISKSEHNKFCKILPKLSLDIMRDHIRFRKDIFQISGKHIGFTFRDKKEFDKEHMALSNILSKLNENIIINIQYEQEFVDTIEGPIALEMLDNETPVEDIYDVCLLKNSKEYVEEGLHNSHCVGNYPTRQSHIISIRQRSTGKRCTIEYQCAEGAYNFGQVKQSQMYKNTPPYGNFLKAGEILNNRIEQTKEKGLYKEKVFTKTYNDVEVIMDEHLREEEFLLPF